MVKGLLCNLVDDVRVVDITHGLEPYNVMTATFVVRQACVAFPKGTVHIIDVASHQPFICLKYHDQFYVCCDNGLPTMAFADGIDDVCLLPVQDGGVYNFAAYNVFAPAAAALLKGASLGDLGERPQQLLQRTVPGYVQQGDFYRVYVHYIDNYGNAYLGMSYAEFERLRAGRPFVITVRDQEVTELVAGYYQQQSSADPRHRLCFTVSATGLLELAVKEGSLARLLGLRVNDSVMLRFR